MPLVVLHELCGWATKMIAGAWCHLMPGVYHHAVYPGALLGSVRSALAVHEKPGSLPGMTVNPVVSYLRD